MLGIYGIYAKKSDFTGGSEDWAQYQISVSRIEDLGFPPESLLSEEWIRANTPASSLTPPVKNGGDDYELLFTVPLARRQEVFALGVDVIGHMTEAGTGAALVTPDGQEIALQAQGWK